MNLTYENIKAKKNDLLLDFIGAQDTSGFLLIADSDATTKTDPSKNWV